MNGSYMARVSGRERGGRDSECEKVNQACAQVMYSDVMENMVLAYDLSALLEEGRSRD